MVEPEDRSHLELISLLSRCELSFCQFATQKGPIFPWDISPFPFLIWGLCHFSSANGRFCDPKWECPRSLLILLPHPSAALLPHVPYSILSQESSLLSQECVETVSTPVPHSSLPPVSLSNTVSLF